MNPSSSNIDENPKEDSKEDTSDSVEQKQPSDEIILTNLQSNEGSIESNMPDSVPSNQELYKGYIFVISDETPIIREDSRTINSSTETSRTTAESSVRSRQTKTKRRSILSVPSLYECMKVRNIVTMMLFLGMVTVQLLRTSVTMLLASEARGIKIFNTMTVSSAKSPDSCNLKVNFTHNSPRIGPYVWSTEQESLITDSFFAGYLMSQIPSGIFARRIGFKVLLGIGMLVNTISGLFIPFFTLYGLPFVVVLRFLQGFGEAAFIPCSYWILSNWSPPHERSVRVALVHSGAPVGMALALSSSFIFQNELSGGWASLFYLCSSLGVIWLIGLFALVEDDPADHIRISNAEKYYIITKIWGRYKPPEIDIPWKRIFKSAPFWAIQIAHLGYWYGFITLMIEVPIFMRGVLDYDINKNGFLAASPYIAMFIIAIMFALLFDELIAKDHISLTTARKISQGIGQIAPAISIAAVGYAQCHDIATVSLFIAGIGFNGPVYPGLYANHIDMSPCFAGLLLAITNSTAKTFSYFSTLIVDSIIQHKPSLTLWQTSFLLCAAIYILCTVIFLVYATSEVQPWDREFKSY